jgi:hypothetical protein
MISYQEDILSRKKYMLMSIVNRKNNILFNYFTLLNSFIKCFDYCKYTESIFLFHKNHLIFQLKIDIL